MNNALPITFTQEKPKHAGGRPAEYSNDDLLKAEEYYQECKNTKPEKIRVPYIEELALIIDRDDNTIVEWSKKYIEFGATIKKIKSLQKLRLLQRTLGKFNPSGAIFQLKANHDMMDRIDVTTKGEKMEVPHILLDTK